MIDFKQITFDSKIKYKYKPGYKLILNKDLIPIGPPEDIIKSGPYENWDFLHILNNYPGYINKILNTKTIKDHFIEFSDKVEVI